MNIRLQKLASPFLLLALNLAAALATDSARAFQVLVTNEKSGDISVIDGATQKMVSTIPVGKRPRGILVSPDQKLAYVAVSGTPISAPPQLDAKGNPIFKKGKDDDDNDDKKSDKAADGIAIVDLG